MNWQAFTGALGVFCLVWGIVDGFNWSAWEPPSNHEIQQYRFMAMLCVGGLLLAICAGLS